MSNKTKWILELNDEQVILLRDITEFFARITAGQTREICRILEAFSPNSDSADLSPESQTYIADIIKRTYFPELSENASYGAYSLELSRSSKIAWDLYQVLRKPLHDKFTPQHKMSVHGDEATQSCSTCDLAIFKEGKIDSLKE